jgi:hypothetical protein
MVSRFDIFIWLGDVYTVIQLNITEEYALSTQLDSKKGQGEATLRLDQYLIIY